MARYPEKAGYYGRRELFRLSTCVGYPGNFLVAGLQTSGLAPDLNEPISETAIKDLLESKHLDHKLEKIFNHYPAYYNRKLFLKAMSLLKHRRMSFSEISMARVAFELYRSEDGAGMVASANVVLQALSMLGRVMSPVRLESELLKQQAIVDFPSRIQMYEFMDIITRCTDSRLVEKKVELLSSQKSIQDYAGFAELQPLPDLDQITMTRDEQIRAHLDEQYQKSMYKKTKVTPPSSDTRGVLQASRIRREEKAAGSRRQLHILAPALEQSQHQLSKARNGFTVLSKKQLHAAESLHASRVASRAEMRSGMVSRINKTDSGMELRLDAAGTRSTMSSRAGSRMNGDKCTQQNSYSYRGTF
jgi:hypothetical protein